MGYTAKEVIKMLGITKSKYASLLHTNTIICSFPAKVRGASNRYSEDDVQKNMVLIELIKCGLSQKKAHALAKDADLNSDMYITKLGERSELIMKIQPIDDHE